MRHFFSDYRRFRSVHFAVLLLLLCWLFSQSDGYAYTGTSLLSTPSRVQFTVVVYDSITRTPLELARVALKRGTTLVQGRVTDASGRAIFLRISGTYTLLVKSVGYKGYEGIVTIADSSVTDSIALSTNEQQEVIVTSDEIPNVSVDLQTGNQVFDATTYHAPPSGLLTSLVQESVAGAARAPTGEVHIRGQHGEFTYYIDGIPIPLGVFGGLNEVIDPRIIDRVTFLTGGFPAEYGGQIAAVMDIQTRVREASGFHLDASLYGGSYLVFNGAKPFSPLAAGATPVSQADTLGARVGPFRALNSNGESLALSDHTGALSYYISGSRQESDRRTDMPVPEIFHDHGFDYFLYGKADYILNPHSYLSLNLNYGVTATEVPYDSTIGVASDFQTSTNAFQTLSYFNTISEEQDREEHVVVGIYAREGGLVYTPGIIDPPTFQFAGDSTRYNLAENRSFTTLGTRIKYDAALSHRFSYAVGGNFSATFGHELFTSTDSLGRAGPSQDTKYAGSDFGMFAQTEYRPIDWTRFDIGLRYDQHIAPDEPLTSQWSPRIRWNFFPDESNSGYLYYGRIFIPPNIEGLRTIASNVSNTDQGTLPERDDFYEAVYSRSWGYGITTKLAGFHTFGNPGIDDEVIGASALRTTVDIQNVSHTGIELSLSFSDPNSPLSGYINSSIIHAFGSGKISGGFLPADSVGPFDFDHDQRLSSVIGINYQPQNWFCNIQAIYGSGLTNGNPDDLPYQTGLFDFNQFAHVTPSWIVNLAGGYTFHYSGGTSVTCSLYITNLFDLEHEIQGPYLSFSAAAWEEPRNVILKVEVHL